MKNYSDFIGQKFGRLRVLCAFSPVKGRTYFGYLCDCGNLLTGLKGKVTNSGATSCGCVHRENARTNRRTHGMSQTKLHGIWRAMKGRCTNPRNPDYKYYGGRGIEVSASWLDSFATFYEDMGEPPEGMTLDRVDNNGNYCVENCRWATRKEQRRNQGGYSLKE